MLDGQGLYLQCAILIHIDQRALRGRRERRRIHTGTLQGCHEVCVMLIAINFILCVGSVKAFDYGLDALWADYGQG